MGSNWRKTTIGEELQLQRGIDITKRDFRDGKIPVVSSSGIGGFHNTFTAVGPGVILGRKGVVGSVYYLSTDYWAHDTTLWVKDFKGNHPKYVYYFFRSMSEVLKGLDVGSANPTLNRNHVHPIETLWAPIEEQKAIAHILGNLDEKIELNRQMNQTLEAMAQALFKSWFVDFDPVIDNALAAGNDIPDELKARAAARQALGDQSKPLPPGIQRQFPDKFVLSDEMGWIPKGWNSIMLSDIARLKTTSVIPNKEPETVWTHFSIPAFDNGQHPTLDPGETIKSGKYRVPSHAVLASKLNPQFPRVWMPDVQDERYAICSTEFMPFEPNEPAERPFLYSLFCSKTIQREIENRVTGSTGSRQRVKPKEIAELPLLGVPAPLRQVFSKMARAWFERQSTNQQQQKTLTELRDTLLPKLMSGELRVPEAEKLVVEAV